MADERGWALLPWSDERAREGARQRMLASRVDSLKLLRDWGVISAEELRDAAAAFIARPDIPEEITGRALLHVDPSATGPLH